MGRREPCSRVHARLGPLSALHLACGGLTQRQVSLPSVLLWAGTRMASLCVRVGAIVLSRGLAASTSAETGCFPVQQLCSWLVDPGEDFFFLQRVNCIHVSKN